MSKNNGTTINPDSKLDALTRIDRATRTAVCDIFMGSDYSSVASPTGKTLVAMLGEDSDWSALSDAEVRLLGKLRDATTTTVTLTFDELKLYQALAARFPDMGTTPPATLVQPSAPVAPSSVVNGMLGSHPVTITISNDTPTASMPIATPTVAPVVPTPVQPTIAPVTTPVAPVPSQTPVPLTVDGKPLPQCVLDTLTSSSLTANDAIRAECRHFSRRTLSHNSLANQVAKLEALQRVAEAIKDEVYYALQYDIPDRLQGICPNPTWRTSLPDLDAPKDRNGNYRRWYWGGMWCYGVRQTKSVWIIPGRMLGNPGMQRLLKHWRDCGANACSDFTVRSVKWDASEAKQVREWAVKEMDTQIRELHTSLIVNIDAADKRLADALAKQAEAEALVQAATPVVNTTGLSGNEQATIKERDKLIAARNNRVRTLIADAGESLALILKSAELFDVTECVSDLMAACRECIRQEGIAFNALAHSARIKEAPLPK
jgi:hypothetical protein